MNNARGYRPATIAATIAATVASLAIAAFSLAALSCSSAPKRPPEVFTNRNAVTGQIDMANKAVNNGDFKNAQVYLDEAWRLAVGADDPDSRVRVILARGNAYFNSGESARANLAWNGALAEAEAAGNKQLISVSKIYLARGTLAEGSRSGVVDAEARRAAAEKARETTLAEMGNVRDNKLYVAFAWKVLGFAEKELGNAAEAEKNLRNAAGIHESGRYLEDTAYDWYLIASVRSKAGDYPGAREALITAISFDRRAENSNGLGMDWMAVGTVSERAGNAKEAASAYQRAAQIFRAAYLDANAAEAERKLAALGEVK